jgi:hypothetical protein
MSWHVKRIKTTQLTDTDSGGCRENSTVLLFLENGPNGFDGLKPTQREATKCDGALQTL